MTHHITRKTPGNKIIETPMITENNQIKAYKEIRKRIIYARYAPGMRLTTKLLTDDLGLGRTPLRESLVRLSQEKLVYTLPQSGTYVAKVDLEAAEHARFVRENLERKIAVECCLFSNASNLSQLRRILVSQEDALQASKHIKFFEDDNRFHLTLFKMAQREEIWFWLDSFSVHLNRFRWLSSITKDLDSTVIMRQHWRIYQAIADKNPNDAAYLISLHLHKMLEDKAKVLSHYPDYFTE